MAGESKTEAIRKALLQRHARLARSLAIRARRRGDDVLAWLAQEVWPLVPVDAADRTWSREEEEALLGFDEGSP